MQGWLFVGPFVLGFIVFVAGPMLFSLVASFTNYDITSRMDFIGVRNYVRMVTLDKLFPVSLWNTVFYVLLMVPLTTVGAVLLSVLLNQGVPAMRVYRTIFYFPAVLSGVGVYLLWIQILAPDVGLINTFLRFFGIKGPAWLFDPNWTKPAIVVMKLWSLGGAMLLYLSILQNVPRQLHESAELDGAGPLRRFRHITLPLITPVIFFDVVTKFIGGFQIFQEAYIMGDPSMTDSGSGGPVNSLLFYNLHLWNKAFKVFDMGYATAMAWVLFFIILAVTLIQLGISRYWVYYEGGDSR